MAAQNVPAEGLNFALEHYVESSLLEAKIEPAYSGEERGDFVRQSQTSTGTKQETYVRVDSGLSRVKRLRSGSPPRDVCYGASGVARLDR